MELKISLDKLANDVNLSEDYINLGILLNALKDCKLIQDNTFIFYKCLGWENLKSKVFGKVNK